MYISIGIVAIVALIVLLLWFRKSMSLVANTSANVVAQGCQALNVGAEYLTHVVSYHAQVSMLTMQEDQSEILHRMANLPQGTLTPTQLWQATNMAQAAMFADAKGRALPQWQQNQLLMNQFQTLLNNARQQAVSVPQAQPVQQPVQQPMQKPIPRGKGTVRKVNLPA